MLWIDDQPNAADYALLPPGVNLTVASSTAEAKSILSARKEPVALLISDIGRAGERNAGLDGLRDIRANKLYDGPAVFFTVRPTRGQVDEASKLNVEVTSSPDELRSIVQRHLPTVPRQPASQSTESHSPVGPA